MIEKKLGSLGRLTFPLIQSRARPAVAALVATVLSAGQGHAQDFIDPDPLYEVVALRTGEVLALRQQPGPDGEIIDVLHAEADEVTLSGAVIRADGTEWYQVLYDDGETACRIIESLARSSNPDPAAERGRALRTRPGSLTAS